MKKIMFNDKHGLTAAVLRGEKTQTRRDATRLVEAYWNGRKLGDYPTLSLGEYVRQHAVYNVGEVIAVAQSYQDLGLFDCRDLAGYRNKMFVKADLMPHRIRITDARVQRLQDISDDDCQKEGVVATHGGYGVEEGLNYQVFASTPREAFAVLIDKISGKGTWERNPYVLAYDFEMVTNCSRLI